MNLFIYTEDRKKTVYKKKFKYFKEGTVNIDLKNAMDGIYYVDLSTRDKTVSKRMKIKRD